MGAELCAAGKIENIRPLAHGELRLGLSAANRVVGVQLRRAAHLDEGDVHNGGRAPAEHRAAQMHLLRRDSAGHLRGERVHVHQLHEGVPHQEVPQVLQVLAAVLPTAA